jgi:hypothetical protein
MFPIIAQGMTEPTGTRGGTRPRGASAENQSEGGQPNFIDRLGDRSMVMARTAAEKPAVTIAVGTVILFLIARLPAEIFYSRLGLQPEDAGLTSIEIFIQGIATVLAICLALAVLYGIVFPIVNIAYSHLALWPIKKFSPAFKKRRQLPRWYRSFVRKLLLWQNGRSGRSSTLRILRMGPLVITVLTLVLASVLLTVASIQDSARIRSGEDLPGLAPWQAKKVTLTWTTDSVPIHLPGCRWLYYLGEDGGRVALYDARTGSAYRLAGDAVQLTFPDHC